MTSNDLARQSANVLLDAVIAAAGADPNDPDATDPAVRLALTRLAEIGAVSLLRDDENDTAVVDAKPLLMGSLILITTLLHQIASSLDVDVEGVVSTVREHLATVYPSED